MWGVEEKLREIKRRESEIEEGGVGATVISEDRKAGSGGDTITMKMGQVGAAEEVVLNQMISENGSIARVLTLIIQKEILTLYIFGND